MKKFFAILATVLLTVTIWAQSPEKMSYQAVIRDASDNLVTNQTVGMQITILQGSASGIAAYTETQTPTSNANGLVSLKIGAGTVVSGDFADIDWGNDTYFIKTEIDPAGGTNYLITGVSQLLSVPYALHAKNTDSWQVVENSTYTDKNVGFGTIPETNLHVKSSTYSNFLLETTSSSDDGSIWLQNPNKTWRIHGDQSEGDNLKIALWDGFPSNGGSLLQQNIFTINTFGKIGLGTSNPGYQLTLENTLGDYSFKLGTAVDNTYMRLNHRGWVISDTINNSTLSFQYHKPGSASTMTVNNEPTYTFFIPTEQGAGQHILYRINGQPKLSISGYGVTTIYSIMKLNPRSSAPTNPEKGWIYFDDTTNKMMVYDGTTWQACW